MKKITAMLMMGMTMFSANAQVNYTVQTACHPQDVKHYDTERLREAFLMEKVMAPDEINVTYTLYDRLIYGGAMPVTKELKLEAFDELKAEHFLDRRELGVINVGGDGIVVVDGKEYAMKFKEGLYVGCGKKEVTFKSIDPEHPAKFYINSTPAYKEYVTQLITTDQKADQKKICHCPERCVWKDGGQQSPCCEPVDRELSAEQGKGWWYQPTADGLDRAEARLSVEHNAGTHPHTTYGGLLLLRREGGKCHLPSHGRASAAASGMDAQ